MYVCIYIYVCVGRGGSEMTKKTKRINKSVGIGVAMKKPLDFSLVQQLGPQQNTWLWDDPKNQLAPWPATLLRNLTELSMYVCSAAKPWFSEMFLHCSSEETLDILL